MPDKPGPAMRLVFEYDGDQVRLINQIPVIAMVPDADPRQAVPGVYVDSRTDDGVPLARVRVHGGLSTSHEVFRRTRASDRTASGASNTALSAPSCQHLMTPGKSPSSGWPTVPSARAATDLATFPLRPR